MPDFSFLDDNTSAPADSGSRKRVEGRINFNCSKCNCPIWLPACYAGDKVACQMCGSVMVSPLVSQADVSPIKVKAHQLSESMWQISCPRCEGTTNFRSSSWGGTTKCTTCGFKINLPKSPVYSQGSGCLCVMITVVAVTLLAIGRLIQA